MNLSSERVSTRNTRNRLKEKVSALFFDASLFEDFAIELFNYQQVNCTVFNEYLRLIGRKVEPIHSLAQIDYLPIQLFKSRKVKTFFEAEDDWVAEKVFHSSTTTGTVPSKAEVRELAWYHQNSRSCFNFLVSEKLFDPSEVVHLALLPHYLQQGNSSLVEMVHYFAKQTNKTPLDAFFQTVEEFVASIKKNAALGKKMVLWGVTYAWLNLIEASRGLQLPLGTIVIETGGMKGRGKELIRKDLHQIISTITSGKILSEYGMTELNSQAYCFDGVSFKFPPVMRYFLRDTYDPLVEAKNQRGAINLIDLANIDTCAFIATSDLGRVTPEGLEILGRVDNSEVRGCNLMTIF